MSAEAHQTHGGDGGPTERLRLDARIVPAAKVALVAGAGGIFVALLLSLVAGYGLRRFFFAYLWAFAYFLSLALGALVFVLIQHVTKAGWSVTVRRVAETMTATFPILAVLSIPILISVASHNGDLYRWALPEDRVAPGVKVASEEVGEGGGEKSIPARAPEHEKTGAAKGEAAEAEYEEAAEPKFDGTHTRALDALTLKKQAWLNPAFFIIRILFYFIVWSVIARWYWRTSIRQDQTRDPHLTERMQSRSPVALVATGLTLTLAAFDLLMSLDPHWYSTMFGVYFFAGSFLSFFAATIVTVFLLQRAGFLRNSITEEHYHDLGKFLFGFVFFWGYIAFSQYMLLWYANIPEETGWLKRHGVTTVPKDVSGWSFVIVVILFCHILIPFGGLLSRHVKRNKNSLVFWAVWVLVFHAVDLYWVVLPEIGYGFKRWTFVIDLAALLGVGGVFLWALARAAVGHDLRPVADPRLPQALAFQNI